MRSSGRHRFLIIILAVAALAFLSWWLFLRDKGLPLEHDPYAEPFDEAGRWSVGDDATASGKVQNGVYEMSIEESGDIFWVTGGRNFADASFEVAATPVEGTIDNGYGMLFRVDNDDNTFYIFKISSDGYVYIGRCVNSCAGVDILVNSDWFASTVVRQGLNVTNILRVEAVGSDMIFFVNDTEVGRATDQEINEGDIGLVAETFAPGGLRVQFDNYNVIPID